MNTLLESISSFLGSHQELVVFLCLGLGYLAANLRIGSFRLGATVGTLLVSLLIGQLAAFDLSSQLKSTFFIMFSFVLGYESGPAFFSNLRSSGLRSVLLAVFFCCVTFATVAAAGCIMSFPTETAVGMLAGAHTQSSVLGLLSGEAEAAGTVAYALTYVFGTVGVILFVKSIAPALLRTDLKTAVKIKTDKNGGPDLKESTVHSAAFQVRAYTVEPTSTCIGLTVDALEQRHQEHIQLQKLHRGGAALAFDENTALQAGDVITVIGPLFALNALDDDHLTETADKAYLTLEISTAELIVTAEPDEDVHQLLDRSGILIKKHLRKGAVLDETAHEPVHKGDELHLTGPEPAMRDTVKRLGYVRSTGSTTDIPFFALAVALGLFLGSLSLKWNNVALSLGASGGALLLGLFSGWVNQKHPKYCSIPGGARWFIKSVGLNLFIAVTALNCANELGAALNLACIPIFFTGIAVTLIPYFVSVLFACKVLKMDIVDALGSLCGAGTCTAALTALSDETGSSAFAASYSPAYAVGNVLLTIAGILVYILL